MYMYDHWLRTLAGEHLIREHVDPKELNPEVFKEDEFCQVQVSFSSPLYFSHACYNIILLSFENVSQKTRENDFYYYYSLMISNLHVFR